MNNSKNSEVKDVIKRLKARVVDYMSLSQDLRDNKEIALYVLKRNGSFFRYMSDELKNDREVAELAVSKDLFACEELTTELKNNWSIVKAGIKNDTRYLKSIDSKYADNKELALISLSVNSFYMHLYSQEIQEICNSLDPKENTQRLLKALLADNIAKSLSSSLDSDKKIKI